MEISKGLKYSKEHEWVRVEGNKAYIGITDFAQHLLGSIVFVEFPALEAELKGGDVLGVIESFKAASDVYSPVAGKVVEINEALSDETEKFNTSPYDAWIAAIELSDDCKLDALMDAQAYEKYCTEE